MRVAFHVKLPDRRWGGVEKQFARFLTATHDDRRIETFLLARSSADRHQAVSDALAFLAAPPFDARRLGPLVLPKRLRPQREIRFLRRRAIDAVININTLGNVDSARTAACAGARSIYWERGSAWINAGRGMRPGFEEAYDTYLANSRAAEAMLRQLWNIRKPIEILTPAVWDVDFSQVGEPRELETDRPLRLGFVGRLRAFKGGVLAVHALAELRKMRIDATLDVAGEGPDAANMREVVDILGLREAVRFHGTVQDMAAFYASIDILLHPALREPYGNVAAEAQCFGIPVVATRVDGLPEVVEDGVTGICVTPELGMDQFSGFGGNPADVYPLVFHPLDRASPEQVEPGLIGSPRLAAPAALAKAVSEIAANRATYREFSRGAFMRGQSHFRPSVHINRFIRLVEAAIRGS